MNFSEAIERAERIALHLPSQPTHDALTLAGIFFCTLSRLGKGPVFANVPSRTPPWFQAERMPTQRAGKTFVVTLRGLADIVSKVTYEKTDQDIKLFFSMKQGDQNLRQLNIESSEAPASAPYPSLIVGDLDPSHNLPESSFRGTVELAKDLMSKVPEADQAAVRLAGEIFAGMLEEKPRPFALSLLSEETLEDARATSKDLPKAISFLRNAIGNHIPCIVLFEERGKIKGLAQTPDPSFVSSLASMFPSVRKTSWLMFDLPSNSLDEARFLVAHTISQQRHDS